MKKEKLRTTVIRANTVLSNGNEYRYSLYSRESARVASYRIPLYSISVEMTDENGNETNATIGDVFSDVGKAIIFYDRIVRHLVTPLNLPYILEDEIS